MKLELLRCRAHDYRDDGRRPPLLFVHGSFCASWVWAEHYLPFFAREGWDCVAVSLRGHGDSEGREHLDQFGLADYVDDVVAAATAMPRPPVVIGHSLGGMIVQRYVAAGHRAAGMVLMSSVPPAGMSGPAAWMAWRRPRVFAQLGLLQALGGQAADQDALIEAMFSRTTPPADLPRWLPLMQRESLRASVEVMSPLPSLTGAKVPALVIAGDDDAFIPVNAIEATARFHGAELKLLDGAPHALMLETGWRRSAEGVLDWLWRAYGAGA